MKTALLNKAMFTLLFGLFIFSIALGGNKNGSSIPANGKILAYKPAQITTFTIIANAGAGGVISPIGTINVNQGVSQTFTITANSGFQIADVKVDNVSVGTVSSYLFSNITANHTISATFSVPVSIALNKSATCQSSQPGGDASNAVDADGSNGSYWSADPYPQWWKVDLGDNYKITSIVIRNYVGDGRYYHYNIEGSVDNTTYNQIAAKTNNNAATDEGDTYNVTVTARYLRVNMTFNSRNAGVHISDFRVYGDLNTGSTVFDTIRASSETGGVISPTGIKLVEQGASQTFTITPNAGFQISNVLVDGNSVGVLSTYTFNNVIANHTISANFIASSTSTVGSNSICAVKDNKKGIVTLISDDGLYNSVMVLMSYWQKYGLRGTCALSTGWIAGEGIVNGANGIGNGYPNSYYGTWAQWNSLFNNGLDIANHTQSHVNLVSINSDSARLNFEINGAKQRIDLNIPYYHTIGFVAPFGATSDESRNVIAQHQYANATTAAGYNSLSPTEEQFFDLNRMPVIEGLDTATANGWINTAIANNQWVIEMLHGTNGEAFAPIDTALINLHSAYISKRSNDILCATYSDAIKYIREKQNATVSLMLVDTDRLYLNLTHTLDNIIFNYPLTLRTEVPGSWSSVNITQNGQTHSVTPKNESGKNYVYYDAIPNAGIINITKVGGATTYTITASAGTGGTINPAGISIVNRGISQSYTIAANTGFQILDVKVDNVSLGAVPNFLFINVTSNHIIAASFSVIPGTYTITSSAGSGGTISPMGAIALNQGANQTYTITANSGFLISDVKVDNVSVGALSGYTFSNITANHTITATFSVIPTFTITSSAGSGGTISPLGTITLSQGVTQTYTISANSGFQISDVKVDNVSVGVVSSYTFSNITANHTISVTFSMPVSIALNKPATSQSSQAGYQASLANDAIGDNSSFWSADPYPQWWKVDLGANYDISTIIIRNYASDARYYHYNIMASIDDNSYTQVADKSNNNSATDAGDTYSVTITARYLKVNMTFNSANTGVHISDFRVYGNLSSGITYTINASAGAGGAISPSGLNTIGQGASQTYAITANSGFQIADVKVDNISVGAVAGYTFSNVTANHTISATFSAIPTFIITSNGGTGGTISPLGTVTVYQGTNQTFSITPNSGFQIADVKVDNVSVGVASGYTFSNISTNHTIIATFSVIPGIFTIISSVSPGGTISPLGTITLNQGTSQTYTITINSGYQISDVKVDNVSVGVVSSYTFSNVIANHAISVTFSTPLSIALNKPASSQSSQSGHQALLANDSIGDNSSFWSADPYPQWWKVDLGASYNINSIVIRNYASDARYYHYDIQASADDNIYTQIAAKSNNNSATDAGDTYNLTVTARYLKVNMTFNSANPGVHLSDFRVYGTLAPLTISNAAAENVNVNPQLMNVALTDNLNQVNQADNGLRVYPNPSIENVINVKFRLTIQSDVQVIVWDNFGEVVYRQELGMYDPGEVVQSIDLNRLAMGVYVIRIVTKEGIKSTKIFRLVR
jgi:hypothetical protein